MNSHLFRLNFRDLVKGLAVVVIVAVLGTLKEMVDANGLEFALYDWGNVFNVAWIAFLGYMGKNFLSDEDGKVLGVIG